MERATDVGGLLERGGRGLVRARGDKGAREHWNGCGIRRRRRRGRRRR